MTHALLLPRMRRVVYSTCSVDVEENEAVVRRVLARTDVHDAGWRLARALPAWAQRGVDDEDAQAGAPIGTSCVRTDARLHRTSGFFVALFERDAPTEEEVATATAAAMAASKKAATQKAATQKAATSAPARRVKRKHAPTATNVGKKKNKKRRVAQPLTRSVY